MEVEPFEPLRELVVVLEFVEVSDTEGAAEAPLELLHDREGVFEADVDEDRDDDEEADLDGLRELDGVTEMTTIGELDGVTEGNGKRLRD